jgi:ligand-binding SRPBCC domain-containing protein
MVHDHIEYELPGGTALALATPVLAAMRWYRHRKTRGLLGR